MSMCAHACPYMCPYMPSHGRTCRLICVYGTYMSIHIHTQTWQHMPCSMSVYATCRSMPMYAQKSPTCIPTHPRLHELGLERSARGHGCRPHPARAPLRAQLGRRRLRDDLLPGPLQHQHRQHDVAGAERSLRGGKVGLGSARSQLREFVYTRALWGSGGSGPKSGAKVGLFLLRHPPTDRSREANSAGSRGSLTAAAPEKGGGATRPPTDSASAPVHFLYSSSTAPAQHQCTVSVEYLYILCTVPRQHLCRAPVRYP